MACVTETLQGIVLVYKLVPLLNSTAVCLKKQGKKDPVDMLFSKPCISSQEHCIAATASAQSPHKEPSVPQCTGNFCEKWACGLCSSPLDSRLYINSWENRSSSERCLLFVFVFSFFSPSLSFLWRTSRQKHYSCPCWISRAVLSVCISQSLARPSSDHCTALLSF